MCNNEGYGRETRGSMYHCPECKDQICSTCHKLSDTFNIVNIKNSVVQCLDCYKKLPITVRVENEPNYMVVSVGKHMKWVYADLCNTKGYGSPSHCVYCGRLTPLQYNDDDQAYEFSWCNEECIKKHSKASILPFL